METVYNLKRIKTKVIDTKSLDISKQLDFNRNLYMILLNAEIPSSFLKTHLNIISCVGIAMKQTFNDGLW